MRHSIAVCERAIGQMREAMRPGITEERAGGAELHHGNIAGGGEWIETRLLSSGPRTNPWFRESSMRVIERGDHGELRHRSRRPLRLLLRTISRSWVCDAKPTDEQRRIYADAHADIQHNKALLKPGLSFRELTGKLRPLGEEFVAQRYGVAMHGVGSVRRVSRHPLPAGLGGGRLRRGVQGKAW